MQEKSENWTKINAELTEKDVERSYLIAIESMSRLNKLGAELMAKFKAHAATDVTGFGLYGHAENLVKFQKNSVDFIIEMLPIIENVEKMSDIMGRLPKLLAGKAVETSGGLFICLPAENAENFCSEYEESCGHAAWIIGHVVKGTRTVKISSNSKIIHVKN